MKNQTPHTTRPAKLEQQRILLVANATVEATVLHDVIRLRADGEPPAGVLVVAPALNSRLRHWLSDEDEARQSAGLRPAAIIGRLRAAGIEAPDLVGDADALQAITDALHEFAPHEIVIATHPEGRSHWLTRGLVGRVKQRFARPVVPVLGLGEDSEPGSESTRRRPARSAKRTSALHGPSRQTMAGRPQGANR